MARRRTSGPTPVGSLTHRDTRTNIPTGELAEFVAAEERAPEWLRYPRDPSMSPQLVWVGKDGQDADDLDVPAVPIYIQEKVHPQALIENLRKTAAEGEEEPELRLFSDFDRLGFEELVDFYQHQQNWSNRLVLGDSLQVMASLSEKESLRGKVQMIYLDPPYGIRFGSNWQVSTRSRDVKDGKDTDLVRQPEQIKAFRDTWELGIHSYLAYLRDRLIVARDLLTESGSVFVQIGDENVHLVRSLLDEMFGAENFVSLITFKKTSGAGSKSGGTNVFRWRNGLHPMVFEGKPWTTSSIVQLFLVQGDPAAAGAGAYNRVELGGRSRRRNTPRSQKSRDGLRRASDRMAGFYPAVKS